MPRRQKAVFDNTVELLKVTPIWVGPILAVLLFLLMRFALPLFLPKAQGTYDVGLFWRPLFVVLPWVFAGAILLAWIMAEIWKLMNRRLLDNQTGVASIRDISWREFERLVSEAYRRKGYIAEVVGSGCGDGGVDIRLTGHGEKVLVQCKQWKVYNVSVTTIRELLGVVVSEKANRGIVVTSGRYTREARAFARQNPQIELVDGQELADLIRGVQGGANVPPAEKAGPVFTAQPPGCPLCSTQMVLRTARKGQNAGAQFWRCPRYPACKGIRQTCTG